MVFETHCLHLRRKVGEIGIRVYAFVIGDVSRVPGDFQIGRRNPFENGDAILRSRRDARVRFERNRDMDGLGMAQRLLQARVKPAHFLLPIAFALWDIRKLGVVPRPRANHHRNLVVGTKVQLRDPFLETTFGLQLAGKSA